MKLIRKWICKYHTDITKMERQFTLTALAENKDPFPVFYLLAKVHKNPWKTCPVVSCAGSLLAAVSTLLDFHLQKLRKFLPSQHIAIEI